MIKSPFLVRENFLSPGACEALVDSLNFTSPDIAVNGQVVKTAHGSTEGDDYLFPKIEAIVPEVEQHYGLQYRGTEFTSFEWYTENAMNAPQCENSSYNGSKWVRTRNRDITGVLFLSDYHDKANFDSEFEVYGGKLEFPQWGFGFNPQRGTLILYPSVPNFINTTTPAKAGNLFQARFHIAATKPFLFDRTKFPGDYTKWF